jgi:hypothetical protein
MTLVSRERGKMERKRQGTLSVVELMARRASAKRDRVLKLAIVRYRHLKSLSENAMDVAEKKKLYEMALKCLAKSAEEESGDLGL